MRSPIDICAFCPRLCRHVCPVTVATARESATPTAILSVLRLAESGAIEPGLAREALELCNGCGACARHCALSMDVPGFLRARREGVEEAPDPEEARRLRLWELPSKLPRFATCMEGSVGADGQLACCGAREGFEVRRPDVAKAMAAEVVRRMDGRPHVCADARCAEWLRAHGGDVRGPDADEPG